MVGLMSRCRILKADREIMWELHKRLSGIIIRCAITSDTTRWLGSGVPELTMYISFKSARGRVWAQVRSNAKKFYSLRGPSLSHVS